MLDNDTALDGLGDLTDGIVKDLLKLGASAPGAQSTLRLAALGSRLQSA